MCLRTPDVASAGQHKGHCATTGETRNRPRAGPNMTKRRSLKYMLQNMRLAKAIGVVIISHHIQHHILSSDKTSVRLAAAKTPLRATSLTQTCSVHPKWIAEATRRLQRHLIRSRTLTPGQRRCSVASQHCPQPFSSQKTLKCTSVCSAKLSTPIIRSSTVARDAGSYSTRASGILTPSPTGKLMFGANELRVSVSRSSN